MKSKQLLNVCEIEDLEAGQNPWQKKSPPPKAAGNAKKYVPANYSTTPISCNHWRIPSADPATLLREML